MSRRRAAPVLPQARCRLPAIATAALTLALTAGGPDALAKDDAEETRQQLEQLEADIARITAARDARRAQRDQAQQALAASERRLAELQRSLTSLNDRIAARDDEIATLEQRRVKLRGAIDAQRDSVAAEIARAYRGTDDGQLKLLLSTEDPQSVARTLAYHRYVLEARSELLDRYRADLAELNTVESTLSASRRALAEERGAMRTQREAVAAEQAQRSTLVAEIETALASDAAQLAQREQDRAALEELLAEIEAAMAAVTAISIPMDTQPFSAAQGAMPWPVDGPVTQRFGSPRNQGKMRWQGVRMRAEAGTAVSAIHHGRVVYADWLRGAGLLLVIDHGEGFMSLYAHNETLLREVGDWVSTGAAVATVGNSGGQESAGLYFEIRKDGKPTDPQRWCRG